MTQSANQSFRGLPSIEDLSESQRIERCLQELPTEIARLNRRYIEAVASRSLVPADQCASWAGQTVDVFLRHDRVRVFCLSNDREFAMADYAALADVRFCVDQTGFQQTLREQGPLPNHRTIHAYLKGRLLWMADSSCDPDSSLWAGVLYNPMISDCFFRQDTEAAVHESRWALLTPGKSKVWIPHGTDTTFVPPASASEDS